MNVMFKKTKMKEHSADVRYRFAQILDEMIESGELERRNRRFEAIRKHREGNASAPLFASPAWNAEIGEMHLEEFAHTVLFLCDEK